MAIKQKLITGLLTVGLSACCGIYLYHYFGDTTQPTLVLQGLNDGCYCQGTVSCTVSSNKSGELAYYVDGTSTIATRKIGKSPQAISIDTKELSNGQHKATFLVTDATYHRNKVEQSITFHVDNEPLRAVLMRSDDNNRVYQGRTYHVRFHVNKPIKKAVAQAFDREHVCFPESKGSLTYEAFIPIACEEVPQTYPLVVRIEDQVNSTAKLDDQINVQSYGFKRETIQIPADQLVQEEHAGADATQRERVMAELTEQSPLQKLWKGPFCPPIDIVRITCDFGTIRTTQHKGRYAHKALDVINVPRSVVWASQDGVVVSKDRFADSGNTVVIDHGFGVLSMFYHLDSFAKINVGDKVAKGNPIGTIGKTGYATGYHLHWEMRVNNIPVDPMQWTRLTF